MQTFAPVARRCSLPVPGGSRTGWTLFGALSLTAVITVLILVSLPRLRGFVCIENEAEARATALSLARCLPSFVGDQGDAIPRIAELVGSDPTRQDSSDQSFLEGGALLRSHGYLFAVVRLDTPPPSVQRSSEPRASRGEVFAAETGGPPPRFAVRAWPWREGRTGRSSFLAAPSGELWHLRRSLEESAKALHGSGNPSSISWDAWEPVR